MSQLELEEHTKKMNRDYRDGNMTWWRQRVKDRFGVDIPEPKQEAGAVGPSVRVDSADNHYHYPSQSSGLGSVLFGAAIASILGLGGLVVWNSLKDKPAAKADRELDPGGLKIEVVKPKPSTGEFGE